MRRHRWLKMPTREWLSMFHVLAFVAVVFHVCSLCTNLTSGLSSPSCLLFSSALCLPFSSFFSLPLVRLCSLLPVLLSPLFSSVLCLLCSSISASCSPLSLPPVLLYLCLLLSSVLLSLCLMFSLFSASYCPLLSDSCSPFSLPPVLLCSIETGVWPLFPAGAVLRSLLSDVYNNARRSEVTLAYILCLPTHP